MLVLLLLGSIPSHAGPSKVLLRVETSNPLMAGLEKLTTVPDFLLTQDGFVFFSRPQARVGQVAYLTAQLTPEDVQLLVNRIQADVADWDDSYSNATLKDLPTTTFTIDVEDHPRTISVYGAAYSARMKLIPSGLGRLYEYVARFTHPTEKRFSPTHATLYVKRLTESYRTRDKTIANWRPKTSLESGSGGGEYRRIELEGASAIEAWNFLDGLALPTMDAPNVLFTQKKLLYRLGIRPEIPGEK